MTWTALADFTTGRLVSASDWNKMMGVSGNLAESATAKATTAGQLPYATGDKALAMLPVGTAGQVLKVNSGATAPEWGTPTLAANSTIATSLAIGTNPASAGDIRLRNVIQGIQARNSGNSADVHLIGIATNQVCVGETANARLSSGALSTTYNGGVQVSTPTGGDKGTGTINVAVDIYKNNVAYTSPAFVFEHAFTGAIVAHADKEGADEYTGLLPLADVRAFVRTHHDLPLMARHQDGGLFRRGDLLMASVEEAYLYIFQLEDRIAALEARP